MTEDKVRRGRPRSEASRRAVLEATARLVGAKPYDDLTIEGIAAESGVAKTTIYRRWNSKAEIVREATLSGFLRVGGLEVGDTGDLRADLLAWVLGLRQEAFDPDHMSLARAVLSADLDAVGRSAEGYVGVWDDRHLVQRLHRAAQSGVIEPKEDFSAAAASLSHTMAVRILAGVQPSEQWCEDLVDLVLRGLSG
ncbi:TetR/AcrR family transcriptional regulator [Nocardiopsis listeri]|uniref:TetR/AcrR family transcriptional regulator n=1 Tax=Nocardiopsis listeri TaxID=53440 RepID=UPI000AFB36AE|nr:TetR/AcrR family transcriptional regulator [Nocardiopsis listeri]